MIAVIIERCNKDLFECLGVENFGAIPFFHTTLGNLLESNNPFKTADLVYKIPENKGSKDYDFTIKNLLNSLESFPNEKVTVTFSDVYISNDFWDEITNEKEGNFLCFNAENEVVLCMLSTIDLFNFLLKNPMNVSCVFNKIKTRKNFGAYAKIIDNPLKYKAFCCDALNGKVDFRLPEIAQGIYVSTNIPEGDFVLVPPVYLGSDVQIEKGCVIGPETIISDGSLIARNSHLKNTFLGKNSYVSSGCHIVGSLLGDNVILRRNSVVLNNSVICHDTLIGEEKIIENNSIIRAFSSVDEYNNSEINFKSDFDNATDGFYGYTPEKAALLGAAIGVCFGMPRVGVACDGEMNSTALKLSFLGGLMTSGAVGFDFGNTFLSAMQYYMDFCELDCGVFVSGSDDGTLISVFRKGSTSLKSSDFYNIKSVLSSGKVRRCKKTECKKIRQIHGMQRMYIQNLTMPFSGKINFKPVFTCDNKIISDIVERAVSKIGFNSGEKPLFLALIHRVQGYQFGKTTLCIHTPSFLKSCHFIVESKMINKHIAPLKTIVFC